MDRRRFVAACGLTAAAGAAGCGGRFARQPPEAPAMPVGSAPPAPAAEALWTTDAAGRLRAVDARTNRLSAVRVDLPDGPPTDWRLTGGGAAIWAYARDGRVARVDPVAAAVAARARVTATDPIGRVRLGVLADSLWVLQRAGVSRVDATGTVMAIAVPAGFAATALTGAGRWVWLGASDGRLLRVDPVDGSAAEPPVEPLPDSVADLAAGSHGLAVATSDRPDIAILDPETAAMRASVHTGKGPATARLYPSADTVWAVATNGVAVEVTRNPEPTRVPLSRVSQDFPAALALGSLWVCDEVGRMLLRIPLDQGRITARMTMPATGDDTPMVTMHAGRHTVWIVNHRGRHTAIMRVDPDANRVTPIGVAADSIGPSAVVALPPAP